MPFEFPTDLPADKKFTPGTWKVYKSRLNSLVKENDSWNTVPALKKNAKAICQYVDTVADDSERGRTKKRGVIQAIFGVLDETYRKKKNPYFRYWQKIVPLKTSEGEDWKLRKNYNPEVD